ncbi:MAG: H+/Na+-translocating ferredoxin:NAD+ oxidoreductase subunit [Actinomycetota bacterium]
MPAANRTERIEFRERNPKWKSAPLQIDMSICINCDACLRHCPPQFGAIFNHGIDVVIIPELCSGCDKCLDPCPVNCIHPDPEWQPAPEDWWEEPLTNDYYKK